MFCGCTREKRCLKAAYTQTDYTRGRSTTNVFFFAAWRRYNGWRYHGPWAVGLVVGQWERASLPNNGTKFGPGVAVSIGVDAWRQNIQIYIIFQFGQGIRQCANGNHFLDGFRHCGQALERRHNVRHKGTSHQNELQSQTQKPKSLHLQKGFKKDQT